MKKRFLTLIFTITAMLTCIFGLSACGNGNWVKTTEGLTYMLSNNEYSVTGYNGTDTEVVIPSVYNGYPVTSIGERAINGERDTAEMPQNLQNKYENSLLMIA